MAFCESLAASAGSFNILRIASYIACVSPTGTRMPFSPLLITMRAPPTGQSVTTTGKPIPNASSMEFEIPSKSEDDTNIEQGATFSKILLAKPGNKMRFSKLRDLI